MSCYHPYKIRNPNDRELEIKVPCGQCIGCCLEYSRQWAIRCMHENQMHRHSCFITLTYRDADLPWGLERSTLNPRDLQLFLKRLRKKYGTGIRYYSCGEYGSRTYRPHYHALIFGLDFKDKKLFSTKNGSKNYTSSDLDNIWGLGNCLIGDVTFESAAYVARYIIDKKSNKSTNAENNIHPEFVRMSRRPGIGSAWLEKFKSDVFPRDTLLIRGGQKSTPPRYYTNKYKLTNPDEYDQLKKLRKKRLNEQYANNTPGRLLIRETVKKAQIKTLTRTL